MFQISIISFSLKLFFSLKFTYGFRYLYCQSTGTFLTDNLIGFALIQQLRKMLFNFIFNNRK